MTAASIAFMSLADFQGVIVEVSLLLDGLRVLILEDEFLIAMDVEQLCRDHGAREVSIARDLVEIDAGQVKETFDVAIVDLAYRQSISPRPCATRKCRSSSLPAIRTRRNF